MTTSFKDDQQMMANENDGQRNWWPTLEKKHSFWNLESPNFLCFCADRVHPRLFNVIIEHVFACQA